VALRKSSHQAGIKKQIASFALAPFLADILSGLTWNSAGAFLYSDELQTERLQTNERTVSRISGKREMEGKARCSISARKRTMPRMQGRTY